MYKKLSGHHHIFLKYNCDQDNQDNTKAGSVNGRNDTHKIVHFHFTGFQLCSKAKVQHPHNNPEATSHDDKRQGRKKSEKEEASD